MRPILLLLLFMNAAIASAQSGPAVSDNISREKRITDYRTYGYVSGLLLSTVNTPYAELRVTNKGLVFNYGQSTSSKKDQIISLGQNEPLKFEEFTVSTLFNFLHYNNWDVVVELSKPEEQWYLLKKREENKNN